MNKDPIIISSTDDLIEFLDKFKANAVHTAEEFVKLAEIINATSAAKNIKVFLDGLDAYSKDLKHEIKDNVVVIKIVKMEKVTTVKTSTVEAPAAGPAVETPPDSACQC